MSDVETVSGYLVEICREYSSMQLKLLKIHHNLPSLFEEWNSPDDYYSEHLIQHSGKLYLIQNQEEHDCSDLFVSFHDKAGIHFVTSFYNGAMGLQEAIEECLNNKQNFQKIIPIPKDFARPRTKLPILYGSDRWVGMTRRNNLENLFRDTSKLKFSFPFETYGEWKVWKAEWKAIYKDLTLLIRLHKKYDKEYRSKIDKGIPVDFKYDTREEQAYHIYKNHLNEIRYDLLAHWTTHWNILNHRAKLMNLYREAAKKYLKENIL